MVLLVISLTGFLPFAQYFHIEQIFNQLGDGKLAKEITEYLKSQGASSKLVGEYAYSLFMFVSLVIASIAIVLIGREDAEEKTILPVKK